MEMAWNPRRDVLLYNGVFKFAAMSRKQATCGRQRHRSLVTCTVPAEFLSNLLLMVSHRRDCVSAIRRIAYACACVAAFVLLAATVSGYAQASQKWYASGHYSSWSNGVKGTLRTYNNYVSSNDVFTAIYVAIVFPNNDWLAVGFYAGHPLTCGLTTQPIWYWDQGVNGVYSCGRIDGRYPSMGTDYIYKVYLVPGTTQWNGNIDSSLVKTTTFSYNYGYG